MFAIAKPTIVDPIEDAALKKLAAFFSTRATSWRRGANITRADDLGTECDPYTAEVGVHIRALDDLLAAGRGDRETELRSVADGEYLPVFDADGNPVIRGGEQMYTSRKWGASRSEATQWLARNDAPDQAAAGYLRDAHPDLIDTDAAYVAHLAVEIRHGQPTRRAAALAAARSSLAQFGFKLLPEMDEDTDLYRLEDQRVP